MQLQTFIASALLLSGLASAVTLPRANEAAECAEPGRHCNVRVGPHCCHGICIHERDNPNGVSVAIHTVFVLLLTQLWRTVLPLEALDWLLAPARRLSL